MSLERDALHKESCAIFQAHGWRWAGLEEPPLAWPVAAGALLGQFERALISRLRLNTDCLVQLTPLRRLFAAEPVTEVAFEVGLVGAYESVEVRTLLPYPWPVRVTVSGPWSRHAGAQTACFASLLSSPVMTSAAELSLRGLYRPELVTWLAKSPFLSNVRDLNLAQNNLDCADARLLARMPNLRNVTRLDVTGNLIGEPGLAELRSPRHYFATLNW